MKEKVYETDESELTNQSTSIATQTDRDSLIKKDESVE